jgi:phenylalanyl-tRNA synthetase beta subunit
LPNESCKFPKIFSENSWLPCVLWSLRKEAKSKRKIQALFEIYEVALRNLTEALDELLNDRSAQGLTAPSYLWKHGKQWFFSQYNQPTISREEKKAKLNKN